MFLYNGGYPVSLDTEGFDDGIIFTGLPIYYWTQGTKKEINKWYYTAWQDQDRAKWQEGPFSNSGKNVYSKVDDGQQPTSLVSDYLTPVSPSYIIEITSIDSLRSEGILLQCYENGVHTKTYRLCLVYDSTSERYLPSDKNGNRCPHSINTLRKYLQYTGQM